MTPQQQRVAISEACGWRFIPSHDVQDNAVPEYWRNEASDTIAWTAEELPDYPHDLNAMHEAESGLRQTQQLSYYRIIRDWFCTILGPKGSVIGVDDFKIVHATAAQRAEAFLRTIGKWVEETGKETP